MGVILEIKSDTSVLFNRGLVMLSCVQPILSSRVIALQVFPRVNFCLSEMHKQVWHLPLSKHKLMLHYRQSVNSVNVCLSMMDDVSTTLKAATFLNLKSCIFRDSRRDGPDSRPPTPCCLTLTNGTIWLLLSGQHVFFLGERHIWLWIISP